jgi:hypothetical protein
MNEIIANYTKIVIGLCGLILTVGYVTGHVPSGDLKVLVPILFSGHALTSGISSVLTGPTANKDVK